MLDAYLAAARRRRQLALLERLSSRPSLAHRRAARPRLGLVRRLLRLLAHTLQGGSPRAQA